MEKIRDVLLMQKRELEEFSQKKYVPRGVELKELNKDIIKVIIGPRRAGKSFFAIHELKKITNLGYANFDDENLVGISNYNDYLKTLHDAILFKDIPKSTVNFCLRRPKTFSRKGFWTSKSFSLVWFGYSFFLCVPLCSFVAKIRRWI